MFGVCADPACSKGSSGARKSPGFLIDMKARKLNSVQKWTRIEITSYSEGQI